MAHFTAFSGLQKIFLFRISQSLRMTRNNFLFILGTPVIKEDGEEDN